MGDLYSIIGEDIIPEEERLQIYFFAGFFVKENNFINGYLIDCFFEPSFILGILNENKLDFIQNYSDNQIIINQFKYNKELEIFTGKAITKDAEIESNCRVYPYIRNFNLEGAPRNYREFLSQVYSEILGFDINSGKKSK
jgi:hypothetical protein